MVWCLTDQDLTANLGILGVALDEISDTNLRQILNDICLVKGYLLEEDYTLNRLSDVGCGLSDVDGGLSDVDGGLSDVDSRLSGGGAQAVQTDKTVYRLI